jgi:hypothetical protein
MVLQEHDIAVGQQGKTMRDMQKLLNELESILLQEIDAYAHLVDLQQAEKRLLVARALEPFLTNLHAKEYRVRTIAQLEQKRQTLLKDLAPLLGLSDSTVTLRQLSTRVPEPFASALLHCRARLQEVVHVLQRCNHENARLLQDSLALIGETLTFFAALTPSRLTYQRSGTFVPATQGRLLSGRV